MTSAGVSGRFMPTSATLCSWERGGGRHRPRPGLAGDRAHQRLGDLLATEILPRGALHALGFRADRDVAGEITDRLVRGAVDVAADLQPHHRFLDHLDRLTQLDE